MGKASLKGDRLNINGLVYTVSTTDRKLHHNNFNERSKENTQVFDGVLSEYHELSNLSPAEVPYNSVKHQSLKHAYIYKMAQTFKDDDTAAVILDSPDTQSVKMLSQKVNDLMQRNGRTWNLIWF